MPPASSKPSEALVLKAQALEQAGNLAGALAAYEAALAAAPADADLICAMAALAGRLEMGEVALALWRQARAAEPGRLEAIDGEARALRDLGRFDEAVEVLRPAVMADPADARLWTSLGVVLTQKGDAETAVTFLDEAVRLDPRSVPALYNRANALIDLGRLAEADSGLQAARRAAAKPGEKAQIDFAVATVALARGDLERGWDAYEARLSPDMPRPVAFDVDAPCWTPDTPLRGRRLLVMAEQGLGDELMFASVIADLVQAVGAEGQVTLAIEPRLTELFARSLTDVVVTPHATRWEAGVAHRSAPGAKGPFDAYVPLGSLPRRFRRRLADFPEAPAPLRADPARVAHWRAWLGDGPPAIGLSWRGGGGGGDRRRQYPPLTAWDALLATPGRRFVNVQYDTTPDELAALGPLIDPPGIDLRQNLDDLAALMTALDAVVTVANANAQLAGALARPTILIGAPASWPRLGAADYPWRPSITPVAPQGFGAWDDAIAQAIALVQGASIWSLPQPPR